MKATRFANRAWAFVLAVLMTLTLIAPQALAANTVDPVEPASGKILVSQTDYTLIDGVTESDIFLNTKEGNAQIAGFMTTIAPGERRPDGTKQKLWNMLLLPLSVWQRSIC